MTRQNAVLLQLLAGLLFSTAGLLIKVITVSPIAILGARSLIVAILISVWTRGSLFSRLGRVKWSVSLVGGAIALALTQLLFITATRQTTAANAVFIQFTAPVYVALFGVWFLKEPATRIDWVTMGVIFAGLFLFFADELTLQGFWGNILAVMSGITFAWFLLFLRKQQSGSTVEIILLGNIIGAVIGLPALWGGGASPTLADWGGLLFLGIFQNGIPFILLSITIRHLKAIEAVLIQTIEPIVNPIWVFLIIGEAPTPLALVGGGIVLAAVTLRATYASRNRIQPAVAS